MTDNDTLFTTDTALHIGPDGHCLKHPVVELQGRDEDGNKFQRESCPECDDEMQRKLDVLKSKRDQVNEKLANLDLNDHDDDGEVPALQKKHSIPHEPCADEGGWTRLNSSTNSKQLSLEALATQMNRMQQMQDWLLMQKEQEMQALRQRVEDQQQQLVKKEVELALLKEKLAQQETRMEHELKLIKLAAYHRRHKNKRSDKRDSGSAKDYGRDSSEECGDTGGEAKNIHIEALHVNVGNHGGTNNDNAETEITNAEELPQVSKEAIETATLQALQQDYQVDNVVVGELDDYSDQLEAAAVEDTKSPSRNVPKHASVGEAQASYAMASGQMIDDSNKFSKQEEISSNEDYVQVEPPEEEPPKQQQQVDIVLPPDFTRQDTPGIPTVGGLPPPTLLTPMHSSVDEEEDEIGMEENQGVEVPESPGRGEVTTTITPITTEEDKTALESEMRDTFDVAAPMPAPNMQNANYQSKSARFKIQSDDNRLPGPPEDDFPPGPGGLAAVGGASQLKDGVPNQIGDNINPVPLEEQITMDSRFLGDSGRFQNTQRLYPSGGATESDAQTVGNTVATSTYGEDRQKVVNQNVLDPYGDSGVYTGVILLSTGMPHGLGRMVYQDDGRTYEGDWRHGRWHGFGRATFANGDSYEGEYRFDQRHGRGLYQWSDGRQYDGEFDEDKRHGKGTFKWPDGAIYVGDFVYGQREGTGRYTFSDGGCYEGDWVDGRYEGYGECTWEDGRVYKGEWVQGMAHGRGVETYANGEIRHEGLWESDEPIRET